MKSLPKISTRTICASLVVLSAIGWSCAKQDELAMNDNPQTNGAIAQARSFYESTAMPLTKTLGEQQIPIKPLPGEMIPQWERAATIVLSDGSSYVDVPIEATITYTAVRHGFHHHDGKACEHDHSAIQAVQKLTVQTLADGSQQSLVATIVPEAGCTAELRNFSSAIGLDGFDGFVSWHDLTGQLIRVAAYENGIQTQSATPDGTNEAEILEIVDNTVLYPIYSNNISTKISPNDPCQICNDPFCHYRNLTSWHCKECKKDKIACSCTRCNICGQKKSFCICGNGNVGSGEPPKYCSICGRTDCKGYHPDLEPTPPYIVQETMLKSTLYDLLTQEQYEEVKNGSYGADRFDQGPGYEHVHGMYIQSGSDEPRLEGHTKMRDYFILNAQAFVYHGSYGHLGRALHPIIDTYISLQTRLNCYYYGAVLNIVNGANVVHYELNPSPCRSAIKYVYNALLKLPKQPTAAQAGAVFDGWLRTTGGGY